jgi:hypothetical protein
MTDHHKDGASIVWEALERAVSEIEALEAIYGDDDDASSSFRVCSHDELTWARQALEDGTTTSSSHQKDIPNLSFEITISIDELMEEPSSAAASFRATLYCVMPAGYPISKALVLSIIPSSSSDDDKVLTKPQHQEVNNELSQKASELIGQESVMELVQELKDMVVASNKKNNDTASSSNANEIATLGRRWIWVHHITDSGRKKSIIQEAQALDLGGFLKAGYPGVVVVEGETRVCDEFVAWIKGNKSRPGGFGRNWGHHVRGELTIEERRLPVPFEQIPDDDLAVLSEACKNANVEGEFKEYVMQHKGSNVED